MNFIVGKLFLNKVDFLKTEDNIAFQGLSHSVLILLLSFTVHYCKHFHMWILNRFYGYSFTSNSYKLNRTNISTPLCMILAYFEVLMNCLDLSSLLRLKLLYQPMQHITHLNILRENRIQKLLFVIVNSKKVLCIFTLFVMIICNNICNIAFVMII